MSRVINKSDTAMLIEAIVCDIQRRGDGVKTPVRIVRQIFTIDGILLAEKDDISFTVEEIDKIIGEMPCNSTLADFRKKIMG